MPKPAKRELKPFWSTKDGKLVRLYQGDVIEVLKQLPSASVHCVIPTQASETERLRQEDGS